MTSAREIFLASCSWLLLTVAASAADVPFPIAKAPPALASSWAGFYLGLHGGYGWRDSDFLEVVSVTPFSSVNGIKSRGGLFGAQAGYNWQFGRAVTGLEFDFSGTDIRGSNFGIIPLANGIVITEMRDDRVKYLGTARGRVGWLPTDTVLLYGTAGLAWERYERTNSVFSTTGSSNSSRTPFDRFGWVAGAGVEAMLFGPHWIGRIEYLHYDFGRAESALAETIVGPGGFSIVGTGGNQTIDVVRAGLSYKFGDPAVASAVPYHTKAPIAAPLSSWAGFYIGAHGGYGWKDNDFSDVVNTTPLTTINGIKSQGWVGGGQAGYNWQYDRLVTGFELDLSASGIKGSSSASFIFGGAPTTQVLSDNVKYLGTLRGRLGWAPVQNVLLYGTAGLAWERVERFESSAQVNNAPFTNTFSSTAPFDRFGWVAGAGVETLLFGTNWIGRLEYLHYDFGALQPVSSSTSAGVTISDRAGSQTIEVVRAGLSYKFGPPAATAAVPYTTAPRMALASWAGFYLGVHGGYGWKENDFATIVATAPVLTIGGIDSKGWVAGGHAGYNWQTANIVAGLELDFSGTGIKGSSAPFTLVVPAISISETLSDNVKYLGTARARLGWTPIQNVLLYGTGGLALERVERTFSLAELAGAVSLTASQRAARDHFGWAAGTGAEAMLFGPNWIGRVEYLHYDFGRVESVGSFTSTDPAAAAPRSDRGGHQTIDLVRAGVSYKFTP
jgi:opacity protein-like surface antigen